ncbi:MAG: hypothetical protein K1X88_08855 [Nannocystaceae bacterium]|nr:hypothetical protein [Nannocystaceae bacterium]
MDPRRHRVHAAIVLALAALAPACHRPRGPTTAAAVAEAAGASLVGSGGPMVIGRADPLGRWIMFCEVRRDTDGDGRVWGGASNHGLVGDVFEPQLWREGTQQPLQAFLDASDDGRWLVLRARDATVLVDVERGTQTPLQVAPAADPYSFAPRVEFARGAARMLYVRSVVDGGEVVVRELDSGREHALHADGGTLWRAWFDDDGEHVWADRVDGGVDDLPVADTNLVLGACQASAATSTWGAWSGQPPQRLTAQDGRLLAPSPGGLAYLGGALLEREDDGRLVLRRGGARSEVAPAACQARVLHLDRAKQLLFYACESEARTDTEQRDGWSRTEVRAPLRRWYGGASMPVGEVLTLWDHDVLDHRWLVNETDAGVEFDFDTGAAASPRRNWIVAKWREQGLVVLRDGTPCLVELATQVRRCFEGERRIDPSFYGSESITGGPVVMLPVGASRGAVVDLVAARVLGFVPERARVHAVDANGRVLVGPPDEYGVIAGPLQWQPLAALAR